MPNHQFLAQEAYRNVQSMILQNGTFYSKMIYFEENSEYLLVGIRIFWKNVGICIHI